MNVRENLVKKAEVLTIFNKEKEHKLNQTIVPAWRHLKVNNFLLEDYRIPVIEEYKRDYIDLNAIDFEKAVVLPMEEAVRREKISPCLEVKERFGVSEDFVKVAEQGFNSGIFVKIPKNEKVDAFIRVNFIMDEENPMVVDNNLITAEAGSKVTVLFDYSTKGENKAFHNGVTKVFAEEGSEVIVVKIQRMNDASHHFDSNLAYVKRGAKVNWVTIEIGSAINVTNYISNLEEEVSSSDIYSAYLVDGERSQDIYYTANHKGRRSECNMEIKGVVKDRAKKIFRGNIDFKKGSSRSKGAQEEDVLLLSPKVKTDSIPMLLCEEEDVEGAHAASVGQMDEDKLFYLMSRGFNEGEAKKLVVEAKFSPIFDRVPAEDLKEILAEELRRRLVNE